MQNSSPRPNETFFGPVPRRPRVFVRQRRSRHTEYHQQHADGNHEPRSTRDLFRMLGEQMSPDSPTAAEIPRIIEKASAIPIESTANPKNTCGNAPARAA